MNEADFPSINLDELRLVPDWMREGTVPPSKQYAGHAGPSERETRPMSRGPQGGGQGGFSRDRRDVRPPQGGGADRRRDGQRLGPGSNDRRGDRRDGRPSDQRPPRDDSASFRPAQPAPVQVVFQPDDRCLASIIKQIRSTHMAYPLFSLARMFLQEPARHWVQFTVEPAAAQAGTMLYQLGDDGPVTLDRATLERIAFDSARGQYYSEQTEQKEPLKGNFANVARERSSGTLLGPTNHHGYQPALRALYEARFSRRMSFEDYRRNIEIVSDPALVERWKEEARTVKTIVTTQGEPPTTLQTPADARAHFRQHYFDGLVQSGNVRRVHGSVARNLPEAAMMQAIRQAHERESRYPAQFVQLLREGLQNAGLHIFKHRKRIVYVSIARPVPFVAGGGALSANVAAILEIVGNSPYCTRKAIAEQILAKQTVVKLLAAERVASGAEAPAVAAPTSTPPPSLEEDTTKAKAALAADLRFLVQAGHIIEFHDGTFALPLSPKGKEDAPSSVAGNTKRMPLPPAESADDVGADPASVVAPTASGPTDSESPVAAEQENVSEPSTSGSPETGSPGPVEPESVATGEPAMEASVLPQKEVHPVTGVEPSAETEASTHEDRSLPNATATTEPKREHASEDEAKAIASVS